MYLLFVMLISNIQLDIEDQYGPYLNIDSCWEEAEIFAIDPNVFSVRCVRESNE